MFNAMYQQPMVIQPVDEQLHQHCAIKEHKENTMNHAQREAQQNMHPLQNSGYHQHYPHNSNYKHNGKRQVWNPRNTSRVFLSLGQHLPQSQEALSLQYSQDSQTDSSSEDLNDPTNKGIKRLHEVNGHPQVLQTYPPHMPLQPRRSQSPQQAYQKPNQPKRHHGGKFGSPPLYRRNKPINGTTLQAPDRFLARSHEVEVRETPNQLVTGSQWDQLSTEIWHKFIANQQTSQNFVNKITLFKYLIRNIKDYLRYSVFVVGSTFNGFGTNTSDLDLCLVTRTQTHQDTRMDAIQHLFHTQTLIAQLNLTGGEFQNLELIEAKVPLLKFRHIVGIDVDVNCNNSVGIHNTHLLHCYAKADWRVQPLVLVVKLWANAHEINDAKNMTISSYSLALMVIHFLQCGVRPAVLPCLQEDFPDKFLPEQEIHCIIMQEALNIPPSRNTQSLGELLLQFFQYYNNFNFAEEAISVRLGTTLSVEECRRYPHPKNEPRAWSHLCIEEPFDHTNTARAVYDQDKFEYIRRVFQASHQRLKDTHSLEAIFQFKVPT